MTSRHRNAVKALPALLFAVLLAGCGGGGGGAGTLIPSTSTDPIVLHDASGVLTLTVPQGALAKDTRITLRVVTAEEGTTSAPQGRELLIAWEVTGKEEIETPAEDTSQTSSLRATSQTTGDGTTTTELTGFAKPVTLAISGTFGLPAPFTLPVYEKSAVTSIFEAGTLTASLPDAGSSFTLTLEKFGVYALFSALPSEIPPAAPTGLSLQRNTPSTRILTWLAADGAVSYNIYRSAAADSGFTKLNADPLTVLTYTDRINPSADGYYRVCAVNSGDLEGLPSNTIFAEALELDVVDTICHAGTGPGRVNNPMGLLWLAGLKQLLIADTGNERVQVLDKDMRFIRSAHGIGNIALQEPIAFAANADESVLYVLDRAQDCVIICNPQLVYDTFFGGTGSNDGRLLSPSGIAVIADGRVIVSDTGNDRIQVFTPQGVYLQQFGSLGTDTTQFNSPAGLAFAPSGDLWICDPGNQRLLKYSADFLSPSAYDIGSDEVPELESPQLLTFDYFGRIFAADSALSRVTIFEAGGSYESLFGSRGTRANQFGDGGPYGLAIDEELGRLFISDPGNNRILEYRI